MIPPSDPSRTSAGPVLTPFAVAHTQDTQPLRAWSAVQLKAVQAYFSTLSRQWHHAWSLVPSLANEPSTHDRGATSSSPRGDVQHPYSDLEPLQAACPWAFNWSDAQPGSWAPALNSGVITWAQASSPLAHIHMGLFGGAESPVGPRTTTVPTAAQELVGTAWTDWWARLHSSLLPAPDAQTVNSVTGAWWSGRLQVQIPWCGGRFVLELQPKQVLEVLATQLSTPETTAQSSSAVATPGDPQVPLVTALQTHPIGLRATLAGVDLTVGQLQSLAIGDVVPLLHSLDRPVSLELPDATVLCRGWLGQQSGQVVVELTTETTTP